MGVINPDKPQTVSSNCGFLSASAGNRLDEADLLRGRVESSEREKEKGRETEREIYVELSRLTV